MTRRSTRVAGIAAASLFAVGMAKSLWQTSLTGKVVLITGGSRGLGLALADEFGRAGSRLAICARDGDELERAAFGLRERGAEVFTVVCDVSVESQVQAMVAEVTDHYGTLDVLVNNAGIIQVGPIGALISDDFHEAMGSMFFGAVYAVLAALPHLRRNKDAQIVNVTSIGARIGVPHLMPYTAAKFAAVGFSEALAAEVAINGIRVLTVVPGLMRTGSDVQAQFAGDARAEYRWFAVSAAIPGLSMDASTAARRIVRAVRTGRRNLVLTLPAKAAVLAHGVTPGLVQRALGIANRLLPDSGGQGGTPKAGTEVTAGRAVSLLTTPNRRAGRRLNQPARE